MLRFHRFTKYVVVGLITAGVVMTWGVGPALGATLEVWMATTRFETQELLRNKLVPEFEARHPGVEVNILWSSDWNVYRDRILTSTAAGVGPDVFQVGGADTGWLVTNNLAYPLTRYFETWEQRHAVPPGIIESVTRDGDIWSIPFIAAPRTIIYLRETFAVAGLDPDTPPDTWEDVRDAVQKLTLKHDDRLTRLGIDLVLSGNNVFETWSPMLQQAGGSVATPDLEPAFVSPEGIASLEFYRDLVQSQELHVYGKSGLSFWNNTIGMLISNPVAVADAFRQGLATEEDVVVALPPRNVKRSATVFTDPLSISSTSKQPDLAWEFIAFLMEPDNLAAYNETFGFVPPLITALETDYVQTSPLVREFSRILEFAHVIPPLGEYFEIRAAITEDLAAAVTGRLPVPTALEQAASKWRAIRSE